MTGFRLGSAGAKKEKTSSPQRPTALVDEVSAPRSFGIRSYLHNFYVSPTVEDMEQIGGTWYLLPPSQTSRRGLFVCRLCMILGLVLLIGGAVSIVVGHIWPHEDVLEQINRLSIFKDGDQYYLPNDQFRLLRQDPMRYWKTAGFCVFASGAVLLAISLTIPTLASYTGSRRLASFISEINSPLNEPPVRIYPQEASVGATSGPVPVMEEISKVQPGEESRQTADLLEEH